MPQFGKQYLRFVGRVFDRTCVTPLSVAFHDATGRYACSEGWVRIGAESCKRSNPGTESPALNVEVRVACSSSIAHPGLAAMSCPDPAQGQITPFDNPSSSLSGPKSCAPSCSPALRPRPSWACAPPASQRFGLPPLRTTQRITLMVPTIRRRRMSVWPILLTEPNLVLPPVNLCRGTRPSHAAKFRPLSNLSSSEANAEAAPAVTGSIPGIGHNLRSSASV